MRATPLLISWHNENAPIYSVHFDPNGKSRLATAGNDNNVRLWRVDSNGEERKIIYLSTLVKHTQAVNVVRFSPKGEMLASAGDDGNVLLWVPSELQVQPGLGEDRSDDKETWRVKHMCRSSGAEIYDLAWSPDGVFIITGSMDNIARIYNAQTGQMVRQIAEHSHYVQGVAWDPLNEFVATQSSDRSVHIYSLKTKDGQFTLTAHGKFLKMDLPARRISSNSPAPPESSSRPPPVSGSSFAIASPAPSTPGTPMASHLPMDPPPMSHSRRSSFGSSPSIRRSASPAPSLPLPAVKPLEVSSPNLMMTAGLGVRNANIYANETFTSFFRRLAFSPDGSLLFTPAGQYKTSRVSATDHNKTIDEVINTVYIYTRAGFNKPPISHLPGHKKPSVAVRCSPIFYTLRNAPKPASHLTLDTSSGEDAFVSLPDPVVLANGGAARNSSMEPPPPSAPTATDGSRLQPAAKPAAEHDLNQSSQATAMPAFALPYRIVYAVATQDAVFVYDTQQQTPLCVVSNLHFATFTDLTWSNDGLTLIMSSSDGFCSSLSFSPGELGQPYVPPLAATSTTATGSSSSSAAHHNHAASSASSAINTSLPTPIFAPSPTKPGLSGDSLETGQTQPQPIPTARPASPARSSSVCSVATQSSVPQAGGTNLMNNPTPILGTVPLVTATNSAQPPGLPLSTPPQTPMSGSGNSTNNHHHHPPPPPHHHHQNDSNINTLSSTAPAATVNTDSSVSSVLGKRDLTTASDSEIHKGQDAFEEQALPPKKRRVAPTLVSAGAVGSLPKGNEQEQ